VCVDEQPVFMALAKTLREQGRADQFISINYKDKTSEAIAWLQRYGNPFATTLVDADGRMGIELGVYGAPETFLIDAQGTIVWKQVGAIPPEMVEREILPRLGARSRAAAPQGCGRSRCWRPARGPPNRRRWTPTACTC
jgi:cytochrome c biogenesis protein CcmG/thiol:disulfide interchange protein DsbE